MMTKIMKCAHGLIPSLLVFTLLSAAPSAGRAGEVHYGDERVLEIYTHVFSLYQQQAFHRIPPSFSQLARIQSKDARDCLVDLLDFNFPPSVSLKLYEQITKLGNTMINHLNRKLYMDPPREYTRKLVAWKKRVQEQAKLLVNAIHCEVIIWAAPHSDPKWTAIRDLFLVQYHLDKFRVYKNAYPSALRFVDFVHRNVAHFAEERDTEPWLSIGIPVPQKDPWGTEYQYQLSPDGNAYMLWSAGPDRQPRTGDDIQLRCGQ